MNNTDTGARWIRAALQVNPFTYEGRNSPKTFFTDEATYNSALLDECEKLGIGMIAVTDHWCVDSAEGSNTRRWINSFVSLSARTASRTEQ